MHDQSGGWLRLDASAGVGKDRAMSTADQISAREPGFIASDFDVSHYRRLMRHGGICSHGRMIMAIWTETEIIEYVSGLPGVVTVTASEENYAPEVAWATHSSSAEENRPSSSEGFLP